MGTPTTHILKTQIGTLPQGIDLSDSVENEFYCLRLACAFGLPVTAAEMATFGETRALVIERFDRRPSRSGGLLRLPQEDCCQALSVPPTRKYQNEGGPGIAEIVSLLRASDTPHEDQVTFLAAQLFFWIIGATDGHAKNFSLFLGPGGSFRLTPLYDILTVEPSLARGGISRRQVKLAMCVGAARHYRLDEIVPRHFRQTAEAAGLPLPALRQSITRLLEHAPRAFGETADGLPADFPGALPEIVEAAARPRLDLLEHYLAELPG